MSGEDTFIARWSRLKQQAADERKKPHAGTGTADRRDPDADAERPVEAKGGPGGAPARRVESEPPFDPTMLPSIESIVAGTDIRAFLQKGVPAALTKAALRRAWTTDPAIRDFIEVAENQWDFTDPTAIPGFGPLQATDDVRQLVGQALGNLPDAPDNPDALRRAADISQATPDIAASAKAASDAPPSAANALPNEPPTGAAAVHAHVGSLPEVPDNPDTVGVAAMQHPETAREVGNVPRRKGHGRAMPR